MAKTIHIHRISYLFSMGLYLKYHIIHTCCLKPFCLPPPTDHKKGQVGAVNTSIPSGRENPPIKEPPTANNRRK